MVRRVIKFDKHDWEHMRFLFKNMVKQFIRGDLQESKEAFMWMKIHISYDSSKLN